MQRDATLAASAQPAGPLAMPRPDYKSLLSLRVAIKMCLKMPPAEELQTRSCWQSWEREGSLPGTCWG